MKTVIRIILQILAKPHLVEFDYRDMIGMHHGRCYVRCLFGSKQRIKRMLHGLGYRNIRIA